jgi:arsenate reductase-like glutaredoxin family protein
LDKEGSFKMRQTLNRTITIIRNRKCRKSDIVVRFLEKEKIPFKAFYLGEDKIADELAKKYSILSSPGIIIGKKTINPYDLLAHCKVKDPDSTKKLFEKLLSNPEK